jgi:hypothetical protein
MWYKFGFVIDFVRYLKATNMEPAELKQAITALSARVEDIREWL